MADSAYDNVEIAVKRRDDQGTYEVGVLIAGAFVTIAAIKTGTVDELVEREQKKASDKAQSERDTRQQREAEQRQQEYERQQREAETHPPPSSPEQ